MSTKRRQEWLREIAAKRKELVELEEEQIRLNEMDPVEALAIVLHDMTCKSNHTDGCGWHYGIKDNVIDWTTANHKEWLKKAKSLDEYIDGRGIDRDNIAMILTILNENY